MVWLLPELGPFKGSARAVVFWRNGAGWEGERIWNQSAGKVVQGPWRKKVVVAGSSEFARKLDVLSRSPWPCYADRRHWLQGSNEISAKDGYNLALEYVGPDGVYKDCILDGPLIRDSGQTSGPVALDPELERTLVAWADGAAKPDLTPVDPKLSLEQRALAQWSAFRADPPEEWIWRLARYPEDRGSACVFESGGGFFVIAVMRLCDKGDYGYVDGPSAISLDARGAGSVSVARSALGTKTFLFADPPEAECDCRKYLP